MKLEADKLKWIFLIALSIIWGSSFILIKYSLKEFSSLEVGALRIIFAAIALSPFLFKSLKNIKRKHWALLFLFGFIGNTLPAFLFAQAQTHVSSSIAGVLNSTTPLFTLIVGIVLYKTRPKWWQILGLLIGFFGTSQIILQGQDASWLQNLKYSLLILLATSFYAFNINMLKYNLPDLKSKEISSVGFALMFVPILTFLLIYTDFVQNIQRPEALKTLIFPAILGIVGSGIALLLFNELIKLSSTIFSSSVTYLIPLVAFAFGIIDGETFKLINIVWIVLILLGIYLTNYKKRNRK